MRVRGSLVQLAIALFIIAFVNHVSHASIYADFYATPQYGEPHLQVQFTNTTETWQDSVISWTWDFGDGTTSNEYAPSHLYENPGAYTVKLTAVGINGGMDTKTKSNYIRVLKADFMASPVTEGYAPLTVTFMGQYQGYFPDLGDELFWDFGDGQTATGIIQPTHTYTSYGYFDVTFKIINNNTILEEEIKQNYIHVMLKTSNPPFFTDVSRTPTCPKSNEPEKFFAKAEDSDGVISGVLLYYSDASGEFKRTGMRFSDNRYEATIPPSRDGTFVKYFFQAIDDDSLTTIYPDTSKRMLFYTVRDNGPTIRDLQYTPFASDISGYDGLEVTVKGIVTGAPQDYRSFVFIQEGPVGEPEPWTGIMVQSAPDSINLGDVVEVTGIVEEIDRQTAITNISKMIVTGNVSIDPVPSPHPVPFKELNTGVIGIDPVPSPLTGCASSYLQSLVSERESWEGMLIMLKNVAVTEPFPDTLGKPGDFLLDDGTGPAIVGSHRGYVGNRDSTFKQGDNIDIIVGILVCEDGYFKILPRNSSDIITSPTRVDFQDPPKNQDYCLYQNFPNPFNPITTIRFDLPEPATIRIAIFNVRGKLVKELLNASRKSGHHFVEWDGKDQAGTLVSAGIYFCRLEAKSLAGDNIFLSSRKLIFIR